MTPPPKKNLLQETIWGIVCGNAPLLFIKVVKWYWGILKWNDDTLVMTAVYVENANSMRNFSLFYHIGHPFICPCALFTQHRTGANHQTMPLYQPLLCQAVRFPLPALAQGTGNNTLYPYSPSIRQKLCSKIKPDLCELILNVLTQPAICETGWKGLDCF